MWQQTILDFEICFQTEIAASLALAKFKHNLQFGIGPHFKQMLIYDENDKPFTFKFDETISSQVKACVCYFLSNFYFFLQTIAL